VRTPTAATCGGPRCKGRLQWSTPAAQVVTCVATAAGGRLAALPRLRRPPASCLRSGRLELTRARCPDGRLSDSPLPRARRLARAGRGGVRWEAMGRRERTPSALVPWLGIYRAPQLNAMAVRGGGERIREGGEWPFVKLCEQRARGFMGENRARTNRTIDIARQPDPMACGLTGDVNPLTARDISHVSYCKDGPGFKNSHHIYLVSWTTPQNQRIFYLYKEVQSPNLTNKIQELLEMLLQSHRS
jgi:hypothetical protein